MAPSFSSYLILHSLLNLLLALPAASTLVNPALPSVFTCLPPTTPNKPTAIVCTRAMLAFPSSQQGVDYHTDPASSGYRHIVYDTALTSVGDPNSPYHLPRTSEIGNCRITVRMAEGVHFARVLWLDVQRSAMGLINRCVGLGSSRLGLGSSRLGPGAGGSTSIGPVMISVEAVASPAGPGTTGGVDTLNRPAPGASNARIGAYYPPSSGAMR